MKEWERDRGVIQCGKRVKCSARGNWFGSMAVVSRGETGRLHPASLLVHTHTQPRSFNRISHLFTTTFIHCTGHSLLPIRFSFEAGYNRCNHLQAMYQNLCVCCVFSRTSSVKKYVYFSKAISNLHCLSIHYGHEAWYWQFSVFSKLFRR